MDRCEPRQGCDRAPQLMLPLPRNMSSPLLHSGRELQHLRSPFVQVIVSARVLVARRLADEDLHPTRMRIFGMWGSEGPHQKRTPRTS